MLLYLLEGKKSNLKADVLFCRVDLGHFFLFFKKDKLLNNPKNEGV